MKFKTCNSYSSKKNVLKINKSLIHILLVEDMEILVERFRSALNAKSDSVKLSVAGSLKEAKTYLAETHPNLVITDYFLPDGNAIELLRCEKANSAYPVVVMTANGNERIAVNVMKAGALDYIVKTEDVYADLYGICKRAVKEWQKISRQRQNEIALLESGEQFQKIFTESQIGIILIDIETLTFYQANKVFCHMIGYSEEELKKITPIEITHLEDIAKEMQLFTEVVKLQKKSYLTEKRFITKNGEIIWVLVSGTILLNNNGKPKYSLSIVENISERKKAQEKLLQNESFLQGIFDGIQDGICVLDKNLDIIRLNHAMEKWYPHILPFPGKKYISSHDGQIEPCPICPAVKAMEAGNLRSDIVAIKDLNGIKNWLEIYAFPLKDSFGEISGVIEYVRDVTERKEAEDKLSQHLQLLTALSSAQNQFLFESKTHEVFNSILNNLLDLTNSECGFIGEVFYKEDGIPSLKLRSVKSISGNKELQNFIERLSFTNNENTIIKTLTEEVITRGLPVIANNLTGNYRLAGFPAEELFLHSFMGLPFYKGEKLVAIAGLANHPNGYNDSMVNFLDPFVITSEKLIVAHQNELKRKQSEEVLHRVNEQLQISVEHMPIAYILWDKEFNVIEWNKAAKQIFGYTRNEIIGKKALNFIVPKEIRSYIKNVGKTLQKGKPASYSKKNNNMKMDGKLISCQWHNTPLKDSSGNIFGILSMVEDITERLQKEEEIREKTNIIQLIHEITVAANEGVTADDAILICLTKICHHTGWPVGHVYHTINDSSGNQVLTSSDLWYFEKPKLFEALKASIEGTTFKVGEGLPGRVLLTKQPAWISNESKDIGFSGKHPDNTRNINIEVKCAFAFPILEGDKIVSVLEFFSRQKEKPQDLLFEVVANLAIQLGRITERKRADEDILKLSRAVEQSSISILITDTKGIIEYVNPKFTELTGYTYEEVIGQHTNIIKSGKTSPEEYQLLWHTISSGKDWRGEFYNKKKNGDLFWEKVFISPIRDSKGIISHYLAIKEDITEYKKFELQLMYMATRDPLTNLFNRRRFREELEYWIAQSQRHNITGALLFFDVDNFKYVNDSLGHQVGDKLLIDLAALLQERTRETDILARLGGDEFAAILPYTNVEQALLIANQLLELTQKQIFMQDNIRHLGVSVSIGIVLFPEHGHETETLITYADLAMYKAKEKGRKRACVFSPEHKWQIDSQLNWEKCIRGALENDQFLLYLQPIMDIRKKTIVGYEALLRMRDEKEQVITPADFLNIAERSGLIHEIDRWVVLKAIQLITEFRFVNKGIFLEVNLSGKSFTNTELLPMIKQKLDVHAVNPKHLVFEITETTIIENMADAQHFLTTLKGMGCRFALDDFGNGFSSFNYLKYLPVDYLKIDGCFIQDLHHNPIDQHLVKAMVAVAQGLGKYTVAEFVEHEETIHLLQELGVNYAQGYYIGKPGTVSDILGT